MVCVVRPAPGDELQVWWFADLVLSGQLILERYVEYVAVAPEPDRRLSDYVPVREYLALESCSLRLSEVPLPDGVMREACSRIKNRVP